MDTKKLRQKILDLAIRGKLVPQDPNDEPASVLLERIRAEKERLIKEGKIKRSKKATATDDEIEAPFEIPESWEWVRLEDLVSPDCTLGYGIVQPMEDVINGIPIVRPVDLTSPVIGIKGLKRIDEKISNSYQRTILKGGEILFCVRASVGKLGIASSQLKGANVTRGISPLRFDYEYLTKYVFYHLQSLFSQKEINTYSRGATLQQINVEDLKILLIALPPLAEQQRIANEVERWFAVIDALESNEGDLLKAIDQAKSKILDLAIHGKLVPQDPNDEPASVLLERIRSEKERLIKEGKIKRSKKSVTNDEIEAPFEIPESWEWCRFGEYLDVRDGTHESPKYVEKGIPFVTSKNLKDGRIDFSNVNYISEEKHKEFIKRSKVDNGDILFAMIGSIGNSTMVNTNVDFSIKNVALFKPLNSYTNMLYVLVFLKHVETKLQSDAKGGMQPFIPLNYFRNDLIIPIPPFAEQQRIAAKIEELFAVLDNIKESLE